MNLKVTANQIFNDIIVKTIQSTKSTTTASSDEQLTAATAAASAAAIQIKQLQDENRQLRQELAVSKAANKVDSNNLENTNKNLVAEIVNKNYYSCF